MPTYEYQCPNGHHVERVRPMAFSAEPVTCGECGQDAARIISAPHVPPDGIYSYSPNLGSAAQFERRLDAQQRGVKVYKKEA